MWSGFGRVTIATERRLTSLLLRRRGSGCACDGSKEKTTFQRERHLIGNLAQTEQTHLRVSWLRCLMFKRGGMFGSLSSLADTIFLRPIQRSVLWLCCLPHRRVYPTISSPCAQEA